jgi:radical SAM superfamily enzyme YgiQ (UPF0313 family)
MKILLIQPKTNPPRNYAETPSVALLTLGGIANNLGHDVTICHHDIDRYIDCAYDIVGITVNTFQVRDARAIVAHTHETSPGANIIIGGPHAVAWNPEIDGHVDKVVIGPGENEWLKIIGDHSQFVSDHIPQPEYAFVDLSRFSGVSPVGAYPSVAIMASRGCPGRCIFCNTPTFWGSKVRYQEPEAVLDQIERFHKDWRVKEIFFQDDTFNINHKWALQIFEGIIKRGLNQGMLFKACCRMDERLFTQEFLDLAKRAGVWNIFFGVESGSQYMLDRMKKGRTVEEAKRALKMTQDAHIQAQCSFIVGLPGESWDTIHQTADFIRETGIRNYGWGFACPFPGTEFRKEVEASGHLIPMDYADYQYGRVYARTDALTLNELMQFRGF